MHNAPNILDFFEIKEEIRVVFKGKDLVFCWNEYEITATEIFRLIRNHKKVTFKYDI